MNIRVIIFAAVIGLLIGFPAYLYIHSELTGGIEQVGDYTKVDLKAMSSFSFDRSNGRLEDVPKKWRDLNGRKVILYGEIAPTTFSTGELNQFELCYSVQQCCFTGPPQVQHFVRTISRPGQPLPYLSGLVKVKGVLHVDIKTEQGQVNSIYQLDLDSIEQVM